MKFQPLGSVKISRFTCRSISFPQVGIPCTVLPSHFRMSLRQALRWQGFWKFPYLCCRQQGKGLQTCQEGSANLVLPNSSISLNLFDCQPDTDITIQLTQFAIIGRLVEAIINKGAILEKGTHSPVGTGGKANPSCKLCLSTSWDTPHICRSILRGQKPFMRSMEARLWSWLASYLLSGHLRRLWQARGPVRSIIIELRCTCWCACISCICSIESLQAHLAWLISRCLGHALTPPWL